MDWPWIVLIGLAALLMLFILVVRPARPRPERDRFIGLRVAHRGLHGPGVPENSLPAFRAAREAGVGVELDVQLTKDDEVVVFHDATAGRICGDPRAVRELTRAELDGLCRRATGEGLPLLREVLQVIGDAPLVCELKHMKGKDSLYLCGKTAALLDTYPGLKCVQSFDPTQVWWFKKHRPDYVRGQLSLNFFKTPLGQPVTTVVAATNLLGNFLTQPDFISFRFTDDSPGFWLCRRFYRPLCFAWTAHGPEEQAAVPDFYSTVIFETHPEKE